MESLYRNGFEKIYDDMYQIFIDYDDEYAFYSDIILKNNKLNVLEIGCGTGNLAKRFINSNIGYTGLDLSQDMVTCSRSRNPKGLFIQGNMTDYRLNTPIDCTIITGRTTSYLTTNKTLHKALKNIHANLKPDGLLCFDFIDANRFLKKIKGGVTVHHDAHFNNKHYHRESFMIPNEQDNFMFNWNAVYVEKTNSISKKLIEDQSVVRAFTINEWELFLYLNNFELIEFIDRKSYAFDTYVVVAKKR